MKRKYEIGFIINPEATEEEVKKIIDTVVDTIKKAGGTIENIDEWGRRKMAYPIGVHTEGIYTFINTESPGTVFSALERRLKLTEKVIRYLILRLDDRLRKANRLIKRWQKIEKLSKRAREAERDEFAPERYQEEEEKEAEDGE